MKMIILGLLFFFFFGSCKLGVDMPTPEILSQEEAACFVKQGYTMLFIRAYRCYGNIDPNVVTNIKNARAAGITDIDVYMFPCVPCGSPRKQVRDALHNLKDSEFGIMWVVNFYFGSYSFVFGFA